MEGRTLRPDVVRCSFLIVHHSQPHGRADRSDCGQLGDITPISPHHPLLAPPVIFTLCQPPRAPCVHRFGSCRRCPVPYALWSERRQRGGSPQGTGGCSRRPQSRRFYDFAKISRLPGPCAYTIAASRRLAVPYTTWSKRRPRDGLPRGLHGSACWSQSRGFRVFALEGCGEAKL